MAPARANPARRVDVAPGGLVGLNQAMGFVRLIELERCGVGGGTFVSHDGRELAVFRLTDPDRVFVIDNTCPHSGGNLAAGTVEGDVVTCPLHAWPFDLTTGVCVHSAQARVRRYAAEVRDGVVYIRL